MVNGNRQQYDRDTGKLSVLTFDRYVLDLDMMRDAPEVRSREAQERFLGELFFPAEDLDPGTRDAYLVEANERLTVPLTAFSFAIIPLACLLPGEFNRRGQLKRVLTAIGCALAFQALDLAVKNLEGRYARRHRDQLSRRSAAVRGRTWNSLAPWNKVQFPAAAVRGVGDALIAREGEGDRGRCCSPRLSPAISRANSLPGFAASTARCSASAS